MRKKVKILKMSVPAYKNAARASKQAQPIREREGSRDPDPPFGEQGADRSVSPAPFRLDHDRQGEFPEERFAVRGGLFG